MDLYVGAIAISNICFLRGAYSWAYFYKMHANAFIRYEYREYLVKIWRKSFSTHLSTINVPIPRPSSIILRGEDHPFLTLVLRLCQKPVITVNLLPFNFVFKNRSGPYYLPEHLANLWIYVNQHYAFRIHVEIGKGPVALAWLLIKPPGSRVNWRNLDIDLHCSTTVLNISIRQKSRLRWKTYEEGRRKRLGTRVNI